MGEWIAQREPSAPHACRPPAIPYRFLDTRPAGNPGSVWRCDCGKLWRVVSLWCDCLITEKHYGQCTVGHYGWARVPWWRRRAYRNAE